MIPAIFKGSCPLRRFSSAILAILFLIVIHINLGHPGGALALPVSYLVWIAVSAILFTSLLIIVKESSIILPSVTVYILLFFLLGLIPILFNRILNPHDFIWGMVGLIGGLIFFISLHQLRLPDSRKESLLYIIFGAGFIQAGIGTVQYFAPYLRSPFLAFSETYRVFGNFWQPNLFASFLATSLVISLFVVSRFVTDRKNWQQGNLQKAVFYLMVAAITFALLLSGSRAGLIGCAVGLIILSLSMFKHYRAAPAYSALWLLAVSFGAACALIVEGGDLLVAQKIGTLVDEGVSHDRVPIFLAAFEMFKENPLFGVGPGNFSSTYIYYREIITQKFPDLPLPVGFLTHPHNEILYRLAETGIVGGIGLTAAVLAFTICLFKLGRERGGVYAAFLFPTLFHSMVEFPFHMSTTHWMLFTVLCYLPSSHFTKEIPIKLNRYTRVGTVGIGVCASIWTVFFLITTLHAHTKVIEFQRLLKIENTVVPGLLAPAIDNLYLWQHGIRQLMDAKLRVGVDRKDERLLAEYIEWAAREKEIFPHPGLFERKAVAYAALGKEEEALKVIEEGVRFYPGVPELLEKRMIYSSGKNW